MMRTARLVPPFANEAPFMVPGAQHAAAWLSRVTRLDGSPGDFAPVLEMVDDGVRLVLVGEASHGTHEFYRMRAELTKHLIVARGFSGVIAEADWPDAHEVNRYVRDVPGAAQTATEALDAFRRFPHWMWRNADVLDFVGWLRRHNDAIADRAARVGFYGMDIYSMYSSKANVVALLEATGRREEAARARHRYACFDHFGHEDPHEYGMQASLLGSCEAEALAQLRELTHERLARATADAATPITTTSAATASSDCDRDAPLNVEQNARVVANAEHYYRLQFSSRSAVSWNARDTHMMDTVDAIVDHLDRVKGNARQRPPRVVVWAHNSHLGDARATSIKHELNVGQLARERWGRRHVVSVGFSTYSGTVTAADSWDAPSRTMAVQPGLSGSYEALFHEQATMYQMPKFFVRLRSPRPSPASDESHLQGRGQQRFGYQPHASPEADDGLDELRAPRLQRAIGVVYRPRTERASHYFRTNVCDQFDGVYHFDETRAVEPLEPVATIEHEPDEAETYPSGM